MNTIKDRILAIIEEKGMTQYKFELHCGLSSGYIKSIGEDVGSTKLAKIMSKFPDISPEWLILGIGSMYRDESTETTGESDEGSTNHPANDNSDDKAVLNNSKKYDFDVKEEIVMLRHEVEQIKALLLVKDDEINFYRTTISSALKGSKDEK